MTDRVLALHRTDLAAAAQLAAQLIRDSQISERPIVTVLDPVLQHHASVMGLAGVELLPMPGNDWAITGIARALAATRELCEKTDAALAPLVPATARAAWCSHWMKMLYVTVFAYQCQAPHLARALAGEQVHLLVPEQPHRYGFHSYAPAITLHGGLQELGVATRLYNHPMPGWESMQFPDVLALPETMAVDVLCHLPTCFYDSGLFCREILSTGRPALALPSQMFDAATEGLPRAPMAESRQLADRLPTALVGMLETVLRQVAAVLNDGLANVLVHSGQRERQVAAMVDAFRGNALLFLSMQQRFGDRPPRTLVLSNHDAGQHGALQSFARLHGIHTIMVPHSKAFNFAVHSVGREVLCLRHPLTSDEVVDLDGCRLPTAMLDFAKPVRFAPTEPRPLTTLGLVLNSVSMSAMCLVDLDDYLAGLRQLLAWCRSNGVDCRIRCRQTESSCEMLAAVLDIPIEDLHAHQQGTLVEFGGVCDLVMGYDVPTSGVFELLGDGIAVVQAVFRRLSPEDYRIVDDAVVPFLDLTSAIARLDAFHADRFALWQFRRVQQHQALEVALPARPLRYYL